MVRPRGAGGDAGRGVAGINAEVVKALGTPEVVETLNKLGLEAAGSSPQQYAAMIVEDLAKWRAAVKAAGIKLD